MIQPRYSRADYEKNYRAFSRRLFLEQGKKGGMPPKERLTFMTVSEFFKSLSRWRDYVLGWFVIFIVGIMVVTVIWQVFTRLVVGDPAVWTEESSTYMLMWCGLIGASYAYGKRAHVGMEYVAHKLGETPRTILDIIVSVLVAYFALRVMVMGGWEYVQVAFINQQTSSTINIPVAYMNFCIPLSGFFFLTYSVEFLTLDIVKLLRLKSLKSSSKEETA